MKAEQVLRHRLSKHEHDRRDDGDGVELCVRFAQLEQFGKQIRNGSGRHVIGDVGSDQCDRQRARFVPKHSLKSQGGRLTPAYPEMKAKTIEAIESRLYTGEKPRQKKIKTSV